MGLEKFDYVDRNIMAQLDKNARISYTELAKKLRMPKETVKYRIGQLEKKGVISGYYAAVDFSKIGRTFYRVYLRLRDASLSEERRIAEYLSKSEKVVVFFRINGSYHIALGIWAKDAWEFEEFWAGFKREFSGYFSSFHVSTITEYIEFSRAYLSQKKKQEKQGFVVITKPEAEKLDDVDLKLLNFLASNGRSTLVEMASNAKVSTITARQRMRRLIDKKIIIGFRPVFDLEALGREYYKVDMWLGKMGNYEAIRKHILAHPDVIYTEKTIATSDIEFDLEVENFQKFMEIMDSFKRKFPEDIRDYTYYARVRNHKMDV